MEKPKNQTKEKDHSVHLFHGQGGLSLFLHVRLSLFLSVSFHVFCGYYLSCPSDKCSCLKLQSIKLSVAILQGSWVSVSSFGDIFCVLDLITQQSSKVENVNFSKWLPVLTDGIFVRELISISLAKNFYVVCVIKFWSCLTYFTQIKDFCTLS